jgi:hypothetical protein
MLPLRAFVFLLGATAVAHAQSNPIVVAETPGPAVAARGVTTLVMGMDVSNGITTPAPASRVRVPRYERVTLVAPDGWVYPVQWTKDAAPIPGAVGRTLTIPLAADSDTGRYSITGAPFPFVATGISLEVAPSGNIGNFSARFELPAGNATRTIGFVANGRGKSLLVRAVGPTLKSFGIPNPAPQPRLRFFDASGREFGFVHVASVVDSAALFRSVGAFPLAGEDPGGSSFEYGPFPAGAYTVQVNDASGQGGIVLVEAYEMDL